MISRKTVLLLGASQLVSWGISYYLIGVFGERIARDLGWSRPLVYGGFSAALLTMGLVSPLVGRMTDRLGGRRVMSVGSVFTAIGCAGLSASNDVASYYAAWVCLGVAMRMTLYDAAFAALARLGGPTARAPMSQITLLGGLASTSFWPIGEGLAEHLGWRGAVLVYAAIALLTVSLHLAIPEGRYAPPTDDAPFVPSARLASSRDRLFAGSLYALIMTIGAILNSAMSAHMIGILTGLGVGASLAVFISTLRGIGQSLARLGEILFGGRLHPLALCALATGLLPLSFVSGIFSGAAVSAAFAFAFFYGAGNGLVTIVRGTLPLALFDPSSYGSLVGRLLMPSFFLSALAPLGYATIIERFGGAAALALSALLATVAFVAALAMRMRFGDPAAASGQGP